jgi:PAS domain S-box-containing protein
VLISFKDLQGRIRLANQALAEALDIPREELIGKTAHDLFDKDLADRITRTDRTVIHSGMPGFEILPDFPFKHGPRRIRTHKVPFRDSKDKITGIVEVSSDISELQQAQDQLQEAYKDLESRVEMRTQELRRIVQAMTGREMRIHELKDITEALSAQLRDAGLAPCVEDPLATPDQPHEEAPPRE